MRAIPSELSQGKWPSSVELSDGGRSLSLEDREWLARNFLKRQMDVFRDCRWRTLPERSGTVVAQGDCGNHFVHIDGMVKGGGAEIVLYQLFHRLSGARFSIEKNARPNDRDLALYRKDWIESNLPTLESGPIRGMTLQDGRFRTWREVAAQYHSWAEGRP